MVLRHLVVTRGGQIARWSDAIGARILVFAGTCPLIHTTDLFSPQARHVRPVALWRYNHVCDCNLCFKVAYGGFQRTQLTFAVFVCSREIIEIYGVVLRAHVCESGLENFDSFRYTVCVLVDQQITRDDSSVRHDFRPFISVENQIFTCSRCTTRINFNVTHPRARNDFPNGPIVRIGLRACAERSQRQRGDAGEDDDPFACEASTR